jgi:RNA polymerase sigma factor (sigma-70 family)
MADQGGEAADAAQQTVGEAFQALINGRYKPDRAAFLTFVYGVARRVWLRLIRDHSRRPAQSVDAALGSEGDALYEAIAAESDDLAVLNQVEAMRECLLCEHRRGSLTAEERYAVIARSQGQTFESLAALLDCSLDTVFRRNARGIEKLRRCMKEKGWS